MLEVVFTTKPDSKIKTEVVVLPKNSKMPKPYAEQAKFQNFSMEKGKTAVIWDKDKQIILCGMDGKPTDLDWQEAGRSLYGKIEKSESALICANDDTAVLELVYGILQGSYSFDKYRTDKKSEEYPALEQVVVKVKNEKKATELYKDYVAIYTGIRYARDLCNEPANCLTPEIFTGDIKRLEYLWLEVKIFD